MSNYTIETIDLTETARLRVEVDQDTTNPRKDWDMATGFVKIEGRGDSSLIDVEPVHADPIRIAEAHERIGNAGYVYVGVGKGYNGGPYEHRTWIDAEQLVPRWARIFHGLHVEYDSEHGGYWFVTPAQIKVTRDLGHSADLEWQAKLVEGERETYRQWAEGEVYTVVLERVATFEKVTHHSDGTLEQVAGSEWEEVESIGGCYLDDDYTAQVVASEYFDLTPEETAALGLPERVRPEIPVIEATVSGEY